MYQNLQHGSKNKNTYDHRNVSKQYLRIVPFSRGFQRFPVGYSPDFCFHNLLNLNGFYFVIKCAFVMKQMNNVMKHLNTMIINLFRIRLLQLFWHMTKDSFSVFSAAESGKVVQRINKNAFNSIF